MSFEQALAYANRIYLANRREFESGGAIPTFRTLADSDRVIKLESEPILFSQHSGKVFPEPKLKWTEHRGANP